MGMFKRKRKGEAVLFAIVALAVSGLIAVGLARIQHYGTHTLDTSEEFLKAEQYALEVTEQLRSTSYSAVAAMPKTKISSGTAGSKPGDYKFSGYYKEIVIQNDGIFKDCKVNIYKDDTDRPVLSLSVAKVDPKALVWGGLSEDLDESTESSGNRSWSAQTTQNYVGGKLVNDYTAVDADGSFSAAASVDYINNKLKDYIEREKCLNRTSKAEVGSNRQPIFVNGNREAAVCNVSYRLNENTAAPNIGILRKDSAGNITLDYWDHDSYFNGNNTSGTTTPDTGSGGGNAGTVIPPASDVEKESFSMTVDLTSVTTTVWDEERQEYLEEEIGSLTGFIGSWDCPIWGSDNISLIGSLTNSYSNLLKKNILGYYTITGDTRSWIFLSDYSTQNSTTNIDPYDFDGFYIWIDGKKYYFQKSYRTFRRQNATEWREYGFYCSDVGSYPKKCSFDISLI